MCIVNPYERRRDDSLAFGWLWWLGLLILIFPGYPPTVLAPVIVIWIVVGYGFSLRKELARNWVF